MLFADYGICPLLEFEKRDEIIRDHLGPYRSADQLWELLSTHGHVLLDLDQAKPVPPSLRLHWENVMHAPLVHSNVYFVGFDLAHSLHLGAEVALQ